MSYAEERVSEAWSSNHAHLTNLAFGILGDLDAAEDAVQEAFARLAAADVDGIADDRGWLTVVTSRICFDKVRSAPRRREFGSEDTTLESGSNPLSSPTTDNPLDRITMDDEVRLALLVLMERLNPAERVVFILHDVFQVPFDSIAETVGRPTPTCRQLARRARLKLEDGGLVSADSAVHRRSAGHPGVHRRVLRWERGRPPRTARPRGRRRCRPWSGGSDDRIDQSGVRSVSVNFLRYFGGSTLVEVAGQREPLLLAFDSGRLAGIISLEIRGGRVIEIHVLADPVRLALLDSQLDVTA